MVDLLANARVIPIKPENRAVKITKNADNSMTVEQSSGNVFTIPADQQKMQAFVMFSILAEL